MKRYIYLTMIASLTVAGLAGCDDCRDEPNVPDPTVGQAVEQVPTPSLDETSPDETSLDETSPDETSPDETNVEQPASKVQQTAPLEEAFSAPDDAVTSEGRFADLMEQGLAEHAPLKGLVFASGGVDRPTTRVVVSADGQVRWARGDGMYWDELAESGEAALDEAARKKLSELVERAWTERELAYPPGAANRGELLVLRDGDIARVIEGTQLPKQLWPLRDLLMDLSPPDSP
jgi:hypothetical protein